LAKKDLYPADLLQVLEFDRIIHLAGNHCYGEPGRRLFNESLFSINFERNKYRLLITQEYKESIESGTPFKLTSYEDTRPFLLHFEVPGYQLSQEEIVLLKHLLTLTSSISRAQDGTTAKSYPLLTELITVAAYEDQYLTAIRKIIDDQGEVRNDASEALSRIRKSKSIKYAEIEKAFNALALQYKNKGMLTDNVESYRSGRRVLSVPAENKRKVSGIIHDESATGKTVFIEPEPMILLNNEILELEHAETREIARILRELCDILRSGVEQFIAWATLIARLDFTQAKARIAIDYGGQLCKLNPHPHLKIISGFHPLLYLKNVQAGKQTVPFDLQLDKSRRILLISGPNAGGKSVLMKAVGLLQIMVQSGFLIPVFKDSEFGTFQAIYGDIGDKQSLEEDLSTYSSHLKTMKYLVDHVNSASMLLIDEFGSGTDPDIGGVIAESMLTYFNHKHAWGVVTTHYSVLKLYAHNHAGIFNGSMLFDNKQLRPTYQFKAGSPGSSFAFELARANGLPDKILNGAEKKMGSNKYQVENLLNDLQREKLEVEKQLVALQIKEKKLDELSRNYQHQMSEFEIRRKRIRQEMKEFQLTTTLKQEQLIEAQLRELEKTDQLEQIKSLAAAKKKERLELMNEIHVITEDLSAGEKNKAHKKDLEVGDFVKIKSSGTSGNIIAINKKIATVQMGELKVEVPVNKLISEKEKIDLRRPKMIRTDLASKNRSFPTTLDIRGFRKDEALKEIQEYIDQAIMDGRLNVTILHGKGNGVLKNTVKNFLSQYNIPLSVAHPADEAGGDGISIVTIL